MKFYIKKIRLWFKNNAEPRDLFFEKNKVNVITGAKSTGKSTILNIVDYCMLSSKSRLAEAIINENVSWYGIDFSINENDYFIARMHPDKNKVSDQVFFSSIGEQPKELQANIDIKKLKSILEKEFGVDENLIIPYGGKKIMAGSKISFRYFFLFNTLSEDTIAHKTIFYDYNLYDSEKYMEALQRIFNLVVGIDDASNVLVKEKIKAVETELDKIDKKQKVINKNTALFNNEIFQLMVRAQEYDLIERRLFTHDEALERLNELITQFKSPTYSNNLQEIEELNKLRRTLYRKIRKLERFDEEFNQYRENLKMDYDSIKPVEFIKRNLDQVITNFDVATYINTLEESLKKIKAEISKKKPLSTNVSHQIREFKLELNRLDARLSEMPVDSKDLSSEINKYVFIGELKAQLDFYKTKWNLEENLPNRADLEEQLEKLNLVLNNTSQKKRVILQIIEDYIQHFYNLTHSMGIYQGYRVFFDEGEKIIRIRKPEETLPEVNIGSKSNYMFLHLCLFMGIHAHMIQQSLPYVPQFLILDQPSQPYFERGGVDPNLGKVHDDDDKSTLQDAFALLNSFIKHVVEEKNNDFQIILLEHASEAYWKEPPLEYFHLVEEFRDGNALIPKRAMAS